MRWTPEQLEEYRAKFHKPVGDWDKDEADPGPESKLQGKIEAWCREWARPCLSFRQSKAAKRFLPEGWPDCTIILPGGRVLFVELKSAKGRLSKAQIATRLQFMALGHTIHCIKSFRAFLELAKAK